MTANALLEDSLDRLSKKLNELMDNYLTELQPICNALSQMTNRGMDADGFRRDLKDLADAVITVRKASGAPALFRELPVPPYDLWLPFKAADLAPADSQDLSAPAEILNHKVTAMALALGCEETSCDDGKKSRP